MKKINCSVLWWKEYGEKALYSLLAHGAFALWPFYKEVIKCKH